MLKNYTITLILWGLFIQITTAQLYINEVVASNDATIADNNGEYEDWIEIYNTGASAIDLAGYYISDDTANPTLWQIPTGNSVLTTVPANGYLLLWADKDLYQGENHINLKLSSTGETILLTAPDAVTLVDDITFPTVTTNFAYGRLPDGSANLSPLIPASPAATNNNSQPQLELPVILPGSGVYTGVQTVTINAETGATVYYTLDGTLPTNNATLYSGPFTVSTSTPIRAISIRSGFANSEISNESLIFYNTDLPIISITTDPKNLWDDEIGIYVIGTNGITYNNNFIPSNFFQDWERPANAVMIETDGSVAFNENIGISTAGGGSRTLPQKSLNLFAKEIYGSKSFKHKIFENDEQDEFKRIRLRNGGQDFTRSHFRDVIMQSVVEKEVDLDQQRSRAAVVFINGAYWGIMNIRDTYSEHYIEDHHKIRDKDSIDLLVPSGTSNTADVAEGSAVDYTNLYNYMNASDLTVTANYNYVKSKIDINEYINYYIIQTYASNTDWPGNNVKIWKEQHSQAKFRWLLFDIDWTMNYGASFNHNPFPFITNAASSGWPNDQASTLIFRRLIENTDFRNEFVQRYATQLGTLFETDRCIALADKKYNEVINEKQAHFDRWQGTLVEGNSQYPITRHTMSIFQNDYNNNMLNWFVQRPTYMYQHLQSFFGLNGTFQLSIPLADNTQGVVVLNENEYPVPPNYQALYFDNIPMPIRAVPQAGHRFAYWQETGETSETIIVNSSSNLTRTPVFEPALDVVINEIHYNPNDSINNMEFLEIYNPDSKARGLSKYSFESGICFEFPAGTTIAAGEYIIIAADASQYLGNGYQVFQWEESKLNNDGENLVLQSSIKAIIDSVRYNDGMPWPLLADGFGNSLELNYPLPADNLTAADWHASAPTGGTPGAQNSTPCTTSTQEIVINEINYNSSNSPDPGDWIELYNPGGNTVDLSSWGFYDSENTFNFPAGTTLEPNAFLVLAEDDVLFANVFPHLNNGTDFIGNLNFNLSNGGERISLFDNNKCLSDDLTYDDEMDWDTIPDGNGPTLSLITPNSDNALAPSWESSSNINSAYGTPGRANEPCLIQQIIAPDTLCAGLSAMLTLDVLPGNTTYNWFISGSSTPVAMTDFVTTSWANVGTYNIQLVSNYFECTQIYTRQIVVQSCNTAPGLGNDFFSVVEDNTLDNGISLMNNDVDPEGDDLLLNSSPTIPPSNGTLSLNPDGTFIYTPNPNFNGNDSFEYEVCDNGIPVACNTATVNVTVIAVNDIPIAMDDNETLQEDQSIASNLLANDIEPDGENLILNTSPVSPPDNGTIFILASGFYAYTPNPNFNGLDSFEYKICDDNNQSLCATATAYINVMPVNDAPFGVADDFLITTDSVLIADLTVNDTDIDGDSLFVNNITVSPANGTVNIQPDGTIAYQPNSGYVGADQFTYEVCDPGGLCASEVVTLTVETGCINLELYVWLEGAYSTTSEMRTDLNTLRGLLPGQMPISNLGTPTPDGQPYNTAPWNYTGTEGAAWTDANYTDDIVDWVLVSARTDIAKSSEVGRATGLLYKDGSINFPEGCALGNLGLDSIYVVVEHRNHIGIMTPQKVPIINNGLTYDFRLSDSYKDGTSFGQKQASTGDWLMFAGDGDQSDFPSFDITGTDKALWLDDNGVFQQYLIPDFNLDGDVNGADKALWNLNNGVSSRVPK